MNRSQFRRLNLCIVFVVLALGSSIFPRAAAAQEAGAIATQDFTLNFGDFTSKAELTYPANARGGSPTVILLHGGCTCDLDETFLTSDNKLLSHIFKDIADYLTPRGIAVLRFDKHYVSSPTQVDLDKFGKVTLQETLKDAETVLAAAKRNLHIDAKRIYIYGWSEGSVIAAALVLRHPEIAGLVVQGVAALSLREGIRYQALEVGLPYALSFSPDGKITADVLKRVQAGNGGEWVKFLVMAYLADPNPPQAGTVAVNPALDANKDGVLDPETEIKPGMDKVIDPIIASIDALGGSLPDVDAQASNLKLPLLTLHGENDGVVPVRVARKFDAMLSANRDHTLKTYPGLGHSLGRAASISDDDFRPIAIQPMEDMAGWLLARASRLPLPNTGVAGSALMFPATGYGLDGSFLRYWRTNGGLPIFGYPIESAQQVDGQVRQYLERARFELHPENAAPYDVLLGRLGVEALERQGRAWQRFAKAEQSSPHYFAQTGHAIAHPAFWHCWSSNGGLARFGYPISEPQLETNPEGATVLTQWFERARFEYYPANPTTDSVLLGRLGAELRQVPGK